MHYGLDIGDTKIEIATFDKDFRHIASQRTATPVVDYPTFVTTIEPMIKALC